jgi:putative nucleotidyltransferase with HDIG domain
MSIDREKAWELLKANNESPSLRTHALAVESVMRHFAKLFGEDEDYWGVVGILHDIDYERYPEEHCKKAPEILREAGYGEDVIHAVVSHGWGLCADIEPELKMEKALYATDELTGLITACAYMRPSKSILDMELKSVKKKYKTKAFAAGVSREVVEAGAEMLGMELDELIWQTVLGMREAAESLGLKGTIDNS